MAAGRKRVLLVAAATLVAVAVVEVGVRMAVPVPAARQGQPDIVDVQGEPPLFRLRPRSAFTHSWSGDGGMSLTYEIDALGFRSGAGPGGATRLVVLGDSFVFGEGVPVASRLTERLSVAGVYNAGVPGWSTLDEVAALPGLLTALAPRAVLIVAQPNDAVPITHAQQRAEGDLLALGGGGATGLRVLSLLTSASRASATEDWYRSYWTGDRREFGGQVGSALRRAAKLCRERGVRLGVAGFPLLHRLDDGYPFRDVHAALGAHAAGAGVPFHDLLPAFEGGDAATLWVHPTDHHPNGAAHAMAAESLRPFVLSLLE